ncbi:MAG: hypothetical protein IPN34_15400 [Planctomycetes bacterium]|nr:hypothetical protein [Planctomycetota bacterium]
MSALAALGQSLLGSQSWNEAEPLLREALAIREQTRLGEWSTFSMQSMLGGALLGQKKLGEVEPLLLDGYRGMEERRASLGPKGARHISDALERLVQLYEALGNTREAARWRRELEEARAKSPQAESPGGKD